MRIMLTVAYDGTAYSGWQIQPNAVTIEEKLREAIKTLTGEDVELIGASRTDAGVHSLGNVAVFDTGSSIPPVKFSFALNNYLPEDIVVRESCEVAPDFHPRHCDSVKTYEYRIYNDRFPHPVLRLYSHFSYRKFDVDRMREAAAKLVGEHDFGAFCSAGSQAETTVRTIYSIDIIEENIEGAVSGEYGKMIKIRVTGSGFLYNMVRIIAGTLMDIGTGLMEVSAIDRCLETADRSDAGPTAPANGLTMIGITFKN